MLLVIFTTISNYNIKRLLLFFEDEHFKFSGAHFKLGDAQDPYAPL